MSEFQYITANYKSNCLLNVALYSRKEVIKMATQMCENCEHKQDRCYCSPNSICDKYKPVKMVNKKSWDEFRNNGLLWWINMILHTLGWAIITEIENNKVIKVYPARVKFRGFGEKNNTEGYIKVSQFMKENSKELLEEQFMD